MEFEEEKLAPVQLDALMGAVNAIQEMVIRVTKKKVYVLPACCEKMARGCAKALCFYGGTIDVKWNFEREEYEIKIHAKQNISFELILPFGQGSQKIILNKGEVYILRKGK